MPAHQTMILFLLFLWSFSTDVARADSDASPAQVPTGIFEACPSLRVEFAQTYSALSIDAFQKQVNEVRARYFPELKNIAVGVAPFVDREDFLRASLDFKSVFRVPEKRGYIIKVNTRLLDAPPSPTALNAILTHELKHVEDYVRMPWPELLFFGVKYALLPIASYERQTDEAVLSRGEACGLIQYRLWLYAHETGTALTDKARDYYTPDDVTQWLRHH